MRLKIVHTCCAASALMWVFHILPAQPVHSPYTAQEVGEFIENTLPNHAGIGHIGIALPQSGHIQGLQPALLGREKLTRIYFGIASDIRQVRSQTTLLNYNSTKLGAVVCSFPLRTARWGIRIGLSPHTEANYNIHLSGLSAGRPGSSSNHRITGEGGINKAHIAQGIHLGKGLHLGAELSYYFGAIHKVDRIDIVGDDASGLGLESDDRYSFSGLGYTIALHYGYEISEERRLSIGTTLTPFSQLSRRKTTDVSRFLISNDEPLIGSLQTLSLADKYTLPLEIRLGLGYQVGSTWNVGLDTQMRSFSNSGYRNSWRLATGTVYTPEARSLKYFKRLPYRFGISWEQLPYKVESGLLQDISVYLGSTFPLRSGGQIGIGLRLGSRGETTSSTFSERYIQIYTGTTLSSKWFVKRKYN